MDSDDRKITQLTPVTVLSDSDLFVVVVNPGAAPETKSVQKSIISGGWSEISEAWSYASASTITIPSGGTSRFSAGVKIRFKQGGGYKYYVGRTIASTLITVVTNTDYTVANSAITDIAISYADRPEGFPTRFTFTCNLTASTTNPTNITTTASYVVYSYGIKCFVASICAASPTNGTGFYRWEVPFQSGVINIAGPLHVSDATVGRYTGSVVQSGAVGSGGRVLGVTSAGLVAAGSPIATLAVDDSFDFSIELLW
jgi:hypothetical protein